MEYWESTDPRFARPLQNLQRVWVGGVWVCGGEAPRLVITTEIARDGFLRPWYGSRYQPLHPLGVVICILYGRRALFGQQAARLRVNSLTVPFVRHSTPGLTERPLVYNRLKPGGGRVQNTQSYKYERQAIREIIQDHRTHIH